MASVYKRRKVGIGLLGSGVVGEAIQDIVFQDLKGGVGNDIELEIQKIYTRNPKTKKWFAKRPSLFTARAEEVIDNPAVEIVVEALGFQKPSQLPGFRDYFLRAFKKGKSVVTSDKAVLARYGDEIWAAARASGRQLRFEACVGGGIPVMRALSESFAAEEPEAIFGIVNGTCNYILSQMERSGKPYADALRRHSRRATLKPIRPPTSTAVTPKPNCCCSAGSPSVCKSSPARFGARVSKIFTQSIFATPAEPAPARSNNSRWLNVTVRPSRFLSLRFCCRGKIFSPVSTARRMPSVLPARKAVADGASAIAIMFSSDREPGAGRPRWRYWAMFANWRALAPRPSARRVSSRRGVSGLRPRMISMARFTCASSSRTAPASSAISGRPLGASASTSRKSGSCGIASKNCGHWHRVTN